MLQSNLSNYISNYNALQLVFPLDIGIKILLDDELVSFLKALEGVNLHSYLIRNSSRGRKGFDKVMLLKIILFARMIGVCDTRGIASLCSHDIRFLYLSNEQHPRHMAFERLLTQYLIKDIDDIFFDITQNIAQLMKIDTSLPQCQVMNSIKEKCPSQLRDGHRENSKSLQIP